MTAAAKLQSVRGMNDLLPAGIGVWHRVEAALRDTAWAYGYQEIRTPVVEKTALFTHSIGASSDIVQKEMYTFIDGGGEDLALRPEATASTVRACNQHGLLHNQQQRLWYLGPMFRRERPQKGRYRQFHQFGVEAFGWAGPDIDAEVIRLSAAIWRRLGIADVELQINTLGSPSVADAYRDALRDYFAAHRDALDADSARRLDTNPLRILDSKVAATREVIAGAPDIRDFFDAAAAAHFDGLCDSLRRAGVEYAVNPRLVRGLDYYTATVFEWVAGDQLGAQNAVCAGGRYDRLVENRGGRPSPAVGFALGLERLVELVQPGDAADGAVQIYVACAADSADAADAADAAAEAVTVSELLRRDGLTVAMHCGGGKLAKQLRRAAQSGARVAVITGLPGDGGESTGATVQAKPLRGQGDEQRIGIDALAAWCRKHI
ncbi:MAG: histidine--tRNA ligase [Gammaproteobacteria bacterium]|nr:histidine--tRNA ligase [Gammaproteobacteria bacterium]